MGNVLVVGLNFKRLDVMIEKRALLIVYVIRFYALIRYKSLKISLVIPNFFMKFIRVGKCSFVYSKLMDHMQRKPYAWSPSVKIIITSK